MVQGYGLNMVKAGKRNNKECLFIWLAILLLFIFLFIIIIIIGTFLECKYMQSSKCASANALILVGYRAVFVLISHLCLSGYG